MSEEKLTAKKSLGQHFLRSEKALNQIVENISFVPPFNKGGLGGVVFEIGPGEGVLTERILKLGYIVFAIEIDRDAIFLLKNKFKEEIKNKKLFIIEKDCLEIDYAQELKSPAFASLMSAPFNKGENTVVRYFLVGNIPYYITGAIFRNTFEQKVLPIGAIFLIQKEVGERIIARDGKESILSISVKIFGQPKIIDTVKAGSFSPPPKVDSVILKISDIQNPFRIVEKYQEFFDLVRSAFHHKRKFALSNIKNELGEDKKIFMQNFLKDKERAEDIPLETWKKIIERI